MNQPVLNYFAAERSESLLFIIAGLLALGFSVYFLFWSKEIFLKGMILPLALIGLIQVSVGGTVYFRTVSDIQRAETYLSEGTEVIKSHEIPRMETVVKNFGIYKWVEIGFILIAITLLIVFSKYGFWTGLGVGLLAQSSLMLILDIFAEKRGAKYLEWLNNL